MSISLAGGATAGISIACYHKPEKDFEYMQLREGGEEIPMFNKSPLPEYFIDNQTLAGENAAPREGCRSTARVAGRNGRSVCREN